MEELTHSQTDQAPSLLQLFSSFLRLGTTAFGGPAMIAYIRKLAVEKNRWIDEKTARDGIALCQTIPGATAMQMTAYVGLRAKGVAGAAASFIGFGLPAFLFMTILSALYTQAHSLPQVISTFNGLQAIVVGIIANATLSFGKTSIKNWKNVLSAGVAAVMFWFKMNPILVIFLAGLFGWVLYGKQALPPGIDSNKKLYPKRSLYLLLLGTGVGFAALYLLHRGLFDLATLMSMIDLFAFGGGFASVPLMFHEVVEVRSWLDAGALLNGIALGQVTPGPIVITATFIGYLLYGFGGGLIATISVFLPSFLIVVAIVPYFDKLRSSVHFRSVVTGVLCSFVGLLLTVTVRFAFDIPWNVPRVVLASGALIALLLRVDILWVVVIGTVVSLIVL
jgi:chromate transporter